ncbi:2-dehydropantoate 2-reductase [Fistulina hepatica ATCC 64428]|uniref:2-dehydropantoate 2-reductase n=1 Tax=Fistulina hepatica ATCC 64428 TaxID=1128425 RepID=A0A0D7ARF5_9AGAR|nr:2-dehydropantoate 2-reductase [Fistulina hepatica ATCC 64428]
MTSTESMAMPTDVLLFGLGGVGGFYAVILTKAPNTRVTVCARDNYHRVSEHGLDFRSDALGSQDGLRFHRVVRSPQDVGDATFTYVVCTNKAIAMSPSWSELIAPAVSKDTTIVLIQNGVGNEEEFRARFPQNTILSGVTWVNVSRPEPGVVVHKGEESMQFGCHWNPSINRDVQQTAMDRFVGLLTTGGSHVEVVPSIDVWRWKKTIWNCTWNTLTALTLCNTAQFLGASPAAETVARRLIAEMASIARALGHDVEDEYLASLIERDSVHQGIYSSMCMDAQNNRPMEVDVIVALPLRKAQELGLSTPTLETICALISAMDWRFRNGVQPPF